METNDHSSDSFASFQEQMAVDFLKASVGHASIIGPNLSLLSTQSGIWLLQSLRSQADMDVCLQMVISARLPIADVFSEEIKLYDTAGNLRFASIAAIGKAINRVTSKSLSA